MTELHCKKFIYFVSKNVDFPFWVKKTVFNAALMSSILFGCESCLAISLKPIDLTYSTLYIVRVLLGVRPNIAIDLCLVELGMSSLVARVKSAQKSLYLVYYIQESIADDSFMEIWKICVNVQTEGAKYLTHCHAVIEYWRYYSRRFRE